MDEAEAEIEEIESRSKRKKKSNSATEALEELVTQHKWHIVKMETVLRLVVNQELQPEDVEQIKDDIEYYIESFADPDYFHDENMYDGLDLDNFDVVVAAAAVGKRCVSDPPSLSPSMPCSIALHCLMRYPSLPFCASQVPVVLKRTIHITTPHF